MRTIKIMAIITWIIISLTTFSCKQSVIYVSVNGNNNSSGIKTSPVATIQAAIELSRKSGIKKIQIQKGDYFDVSVVLNQQDSGLSIAGEAGNKVRLFGGKVLNGLKQTGTFLEAPVPESVLKDLDFRILIVNNSLCERARLPQTGAFNHMSEWPYQWQSSQGGWAKKTSETDLRTLYYNPRDIGPWLDVHNAELTVFHAWDDSYVVLSGIDTVNRKLTFSNSATHPAGAFASWAGPKTHQYIIWNIREGMTLPGQWYVDRTNRKIVYWPKTGERPENIQVLVPIQTHIFEIEKNTSGIMLENLQLSCSGGPIVNSGYGTENVTGAIVADKVRNFSLKKIIIKNVAGWAVKLNGSNISITDCEFSFTGAGGLNYNGRHISVERCGIHDTGKLYFGAVGIMGGGNYNQVSHCELYNIPYFAINGLGNQSVAEYNLIYSFKQSMVDGGAIYKVLTLL